MPQLQMARMFTRELLATKRQPRGPTPSTALGHRAIAAAMQDGGSVDGRTAAGYLYHTARITQTIVGARTCVDFGCGTAVQLIQVAQLNPSTRFIGVDSNPELLSEAAASAKAWKIDNVEWRLDDIRKPATLADNAIDAAISTMTLHDLATVAEIRACLGAMQSLVGANGAIYIEDFARLKSPKSVDFFVNLNAPSPPDQFSTLYRHSLSAAFTIHELREAVSALSGATLHATFLVPFLVVIKTPDRPLAPDQRDSLHRLRTALPSNTRNDLDDLRRFFALGGLRNDPFT
jgi:arsenite methyltransferase